MLTTLAEAAIRTLLLACLVQSSLCLLRIRQPRLRLVAWSIVLAASLAMPLIQRAFSIPLAVMPAMPLADTMTFPMPLRDVASQVFAPARTVAEDTSSTTQQWLVAIYLLVSAALLLRVAVGFVLCLRMLARAGKAPNAWGAAGRVRTSHDVTGPVTIAGCILLPADAISWSHTTRQAVLAHEGAHVAHWDFWMLLFSQVNRALFWFSPLSWWLHRHLARLAELASDDHALAVVGDNVRYAETLLEMGRRSRALLRGVGMARLATLPHRIERVLSGRSRPDPVSRTWGVALVVGAAGLSVAAATMEPVASSSVRAVITAQHDAAAPTIANPAATAQASVRPPEIADSWRQHEPAAEAPWRTGSTTSQPALVVRAATRPRPRSASRKSLLHQTVRQDGRALPGQPRPGPLMDALATDNAPEGPLAVTRAIARQADAATWRTHAPAAEGPGPPPAAEQHLVRSINQQTCAGSYLPGPIGAHPGGWLNLVRASFFRKTDGTQWLTFTFGTQTPVVLPVTVTGRQLEFVGGADTAFRIMPQGANHLSGTTQHPYGTIDLLCSGPNVHLFDEAS